jgi:Flp pilus assembly protein TadD
MTLRDFSPTHDTLLPTNSPFAEVTGDGELAVKLARELELKSAEAFALCNLALCSDGAGNYSYAFECARDALELAEELAHRQWQCRVHMALGIICHDIYALSDARRHLELAFQLSNEMGSGHYIGNVARFLASTYILQGELALAEAILADVLARDAAARTTAQRNVLYAWAELALARHKPRRVLQIA